MQDVTVLLTACGSPSMPGFVKCLRNNGERNLHIIGVDMKADPTILQMADEYFLVPAASASNYIDCLYTICKENKVDILIPGISSELLALALRREEFEKIGTKISVSDEKSIKIANNKLLLYKYMREQELTVPDFYPIHKVEELKGVCQKLGYPEKAICIKASESSGSRGIRIIDSTKSRFDILFDEKPNSFYISMEELIHILQEKSEMPEMMAMEYLPGCEYTVDILADHGKVIFIAGRRNKISLMSIAQESVLEKKDSAYELCTKLVSILNFDGNIGFDFMLDENDRPILTDANPRITATLSIFAAGGLNLPYLRIKQLLGEPLPKVTIDYGTVMKRRYLEQFIDSKGQAIAF